MKNQEITKIDKQYYLPVFGRFPIALKKGKGVYVWDYDGNKYLDAYAGIAVNNLGHAHPKIVKTIKNQASKLIHISNFYASKPQALLAKKLVELSGLDKAFFANSGAEAVEGAYKLARKYAHKNGKGGNIICIENCFHGRTLATIATGKEKYQKGFEPIPSGFVKVHFNDIEEIKKTITPETAAIIVEPIQGEGGINIHTKEYLTELRAICDKNDIVLIFDEVQCGIGRTGKFFGFEHFGVIPDIITMAKGLASGFPIGGILVKQKIADAINPGDHGSTFGGNPLACAVALTSVSIISDAAFLKSVEQNGKKAIEKLISFAKKEPRIKEVRGIGLMIGVELEFEGRKIIEKMLEKKVLSNVTVDKVIRFVPPLIISDKEMNKILDVFIESYNECKVLN